MRMTLSQEMLYNAMPLFYKPGDSEIVMYAFCRLCDIRDHADRIANDHSQTA